MKVCIDGVRLNVQVRPLLKAGILEKRFEETRVSFELFNDVYDRGKEGHNYLYPYRKELVNTCLSFDL